MRETRPTEPATPPGEGERHGVAAARRPAANAQSTLFAPLRRLLGSSLRLQRRGLQVHVVLEPMAAPVAAEAPGTSRGALLRAEHRRLAEFLHQNADLRYTLRHLACVEQTLARNGARALNSLPEKVLRKSLEQIEGLRRDDAAFVLPELVQRLQRALEGLKVHVSQFDATEAMDISEASHSLFDEMERSWNGRMPEAR